MIVIDTSVLIDCLTGAKLSAPAIRGAIADGEEFLLPALVLYEWLRGPRLSEELAAQERLFPSESAIPFDKEQAKVSADLYRSLRRARTREVDIAIAACALVHDARLWTLNRADFQDVPGIQLYGPG